MCVLCASNPFVAWHSLDQTVPAPQQLGSGAGANSNGTSLSINTALVDQLDSGIFWRTSSGNVASTITFGMPTSSTFAGSNGEAAGWQAATATQATAVRAIMELWDDLITPSIVETSQPNTADIKISQTTTAISYAHAYYAGTAGQETGSYDKIAGSVWLNPSAASLQSPVTGTYGFSAIIHEVGHALGLNHAGNYNGGSPAYGNASTGWLFDEDSRQYTLMSYFNASNTGAIWGGHYAQTPMVYDILAIQQMYGADYTTRAGNTVYGFNANAGNRLYDFTQNTIPILTIWDGAGTDTIDLTGWSSNSTLNMAAGSFSSVNSFTWNLAIAYDVDIENAKTGAGHDTVNGNDLGNVISGGAGNDTIKGASGNDVLDGGAGIDVLDGGAGNDRIYFDASDDLSQVTGGSGTDTLVQRGFHDEFDFQALAFEVLQSIYADDQGADWQQRSDSYNADGQLFESETRYDDGSRSVTLFDVADAETWSEQTTRYNASGSVKSVLVTSDDGEPQLAAVVDRPPVITSSSDLYMYENRHTAGMVKATDPEGDTVSFRITGGADAAKFRINAATGNLTMINAADFEAAADVNANNVYSVRIEASADGRTDTQNILLRVRDINETPLLKLVSARIDGMVQVKEGYVTAARFTASDEDAGSFLKFSIAGGRDAADFRIDARTGVLKFKTAADYEARSDSNRDNVFEVTVKVSDGVNSTLKAIKINILNGPEPLLRAPADSTAPTHDFGDFSRLHGNEDQFDASGVGNKSGIFPFDGIFLE